MCNSQVYTFKAPDKQTREQWVKAIQDAIDELCKNTSYMLAAQKATRVVSPERHASLVPGAEVVATEQYQGPVINVGDEFILLEILDEGWVLIRPAESNKTCKFDQAQVPAKILRMKDDRSSQDITSPREDKSARNRLASVIKLVMQNNQQLKLNKRGVMITSPEDHKSSPLLPVTDSKLKKKNSLQRILDIK